MYNFIYFVSKKKFFSLAIVILGIFSLIIFDNLYNVFATTDNSNNNDNGDKKFQLNVIINLNNIKQENPQLLKLIAFINGDIQTKIIDLKKNATISENSKITTPFYFNTSNEISKLIVGDEYFVCGYIVKKNDNVNSSIIIIINQCHMTVMKVVLPLQLKILLVCFQQ